MKKKNSIKALSVVLSAVLAFSFLTGNSFTFAQETTTQAQTSEEESTTLSEEEKRAEAQKKLEEQKAALEADLKASEEKIALLSAQSKDTEEYINALDEKIGVLNEQLTVLDEQVLGYEEDIDYLQKNIDVNQADCDKLQAEVDEVQAKLDELNLKFQSKYDAYCMRARAIYISGNFNIITALLTCGDISSFLTRYEMIKAVSKSDAELLKSIEEETNKILQQEADLTEKKAALDEIKMTLLAQQNELKAKQASLTAAQEEIAGKKAILAQDRAESDMLFARLTAENGMYTEYRNEDKALTEAAEKEISNLLNGIISPDDVSDFTTGDRSDTPTVVYKDTDVYSKSDGVYNMTYPVPGYYTISAGFPNYSNGGYHGGIDFPCPQGTAIVAAQKGVVIGVKRLDYSYGYYVLIYHGTDSKGRKVVTLYAHNSSILVSPGDTVYKGQQIAKAGSTGNSTGPHCHFEIRVDDTKINPKNYLSK